MRKFFLVLAIPFTISSCGELGLELAQSPQSQEINLQSSDELGATKGTIQVNEQGETIVVNSKGRRITSFCSTLRIDGGFELYEYSKKYLASYFKTRELKQLFIAWYFSEDSAFMALSVKRCPDKKNKHYYALRTLLRKNSIIQDLITVNMRTKEHANLAETYMDEYRDLFPKDIK